MARYTGPKCKLSRREGTDLFLKSGIKPLEGKCRKSAPGGSRRAIGGRKMDYLEHLREKQKVRRIYGVLEKQFRNYYHRADRMRGATGANLLQLLESRLDNIVYRLGFASTRAQARQMVTHKLVTVGGAAVNIPSFQVAVGQTVALTERGQKLAIVKDALEIGAQRQPEWLDVDAEKFSGVIRELPERDAVAQDINENLIVEFYSK